MIKIDNFSIDSTEKWVHIDVSVSPECTESVTIEKIGISVSPTFDNHCLTQTLIATLGAANPTIVATQTMDSLYPTVPAVPSNVTISTTGVQQINIDIDISEMKLPADKKMFFLYVKVLNTDPTVCSTCAYEEEVYGVAFNKKPIYNAIACAVHELDGCVIPMHFINYLFKLKALEYAIEIGDYEKAYDYFTTLIVGIHTRVNPHRVHSTCNCRN